MEKLKSQVNVTFWFSCQSDILVLADVPPTPGMEKLKSQVNVTFWFSGPGQSDILVLANVPLPEIEIGLNMNAIDKTISREVIKYILQSTTPPPPLPLPLSDSVPEQETGEFQFQIDMDMWTRTRSTTPLQP